METVDDHEIAKLQELVRVLAAGLNVSASFEVPADVRRHVDAGQTVKAMREMRRQTPGQLSLMAAKRMVDALRGEDPE